MGCGLAGLPYFPCLRGTKFLFRLRAGKFSSAAPNNADGGNSGVAIVGSASLVARSGVIYKFHLVFVVNMIFFMGAPTILMRLTRNPTDVSGVVATVDAPDGASPPGNTGEA